MSQSNCSEPQVTSFRMSTVLPVAPVLPLPSAGFGGQALSDDVTPGALPPEPTTSPDHLHLLDDPQEWGTFSRPSSLVQSGWESNLMIEGMHCAACAMTVEAALLGVPGVLKAEVSAGSHRARVVWSADQVKPSSWLIAIQNSGYRAVPANDAFARERRKNESRQALWRMLVAALCMMQVMMYAYPAYTAAPGDLSDELEQLLRWASWVLTLPVVIFSCGPFLKNALRDIAGRRISMDFPVALGMLITFVVSTAGTFDPQGIFGKEVFFDSLTMFVFFLLAGRWLELRLRDRTAGALEALMNRLPDSVLRQQPDGSFARVPVRRLAPGDVIRVLPGESFPADGDVLQGEALVDEALLTGESRPVRRGVGDLVIAGSHNLSSVVLVRLERVGADTRFAQIVSLMESASTTKPPIARLADRIAKPFLVLVLLAAGLSCAYWWRHDPGHALMVAVAVLIVTCPCALSLATPAAMLAAAGNLAQRGVLVRRLEAFEALAEIDTVMFDKTGTLTRDAMILGVTQTRAGVSAEMALQQAAALAQQSLHPVSKALVAAVGGTNALAAWRVLAVSEVAGQGVTARLAPAGHPLDSRTLRLGSAAFCGLENRPGATLQAHLSDDSGWVATFELLEAVRPDAKETVSALEQAGISVHLLSGDGALAARRVGADVGIEKVRGDCAPQDKLDFLQQAQFNGGKVAVVGDGLNDGPVLAGAHVSFAFGSAVPLAQAQSDFVIMGDHLAEVTKTVFLARRTMLIVRQNLMWAAVYNAVCVPLAVVGWLPAWLAGLGMALSSLFVVLNAMRLAKSKVSA